MPSGDTTYLPHILNSVASSDREKIAIRDAQNTITYGDLQKHSDQLANYLIGVGVEKGEVVGLLMDHSIHYVVGLLGVTKAGGIFMPLSKSTPVKRMEQIIADAKPRLILADEELSGTVEYCRFNVFEDGAWTQASDRDPGLSFDDKDALYIFHTSGSTGKPKAIVGLHRSLVHFLQWERDFFQVDKDAVVGAMTPTTFDPSLRDIFVPLVSGATLVIPDQQQIDFTHRMEWLIRERIEIIHAVPSVFDKLMDELAADPSKQKQLVLSHVLFAGEALYAEKLKKWKPLLPQHIRFTNLYGPTETTLAKFYHQVTETDLEKGGVVLLGKPIPNAKVILLNHQGEALPDGEVGEIGIQTPFGTRGYLDRSLNENRFIEWPGSDVPVYRSGDLGRVDDRGMLEYHGRRDFQVKINGIRVEISEIEATILKHPEVKSCVVVYESTGPEKPKELVAFVQGDSSATEVLHEFLKDYLNPAMIPGRFLPVDSIPLNANGKVDRKKLMDQLAEMASLEKVEPEEMSVKQQTIHSIWAEVLKKERIGLDENFFAIGGHSLNGLVIISKVVKVFGVRFEINSFFDYPTIRSFSDFLESLAETSKDDGEGEIPLIEKQDAYPASDAQRRMFLLNEITGNGAVYNIQGAFQINQVVQRELLADALKQVVARHESLRTNFVKSDSGDITQTIHSAESFPFHLDYRVITSEKACRKHLAGEFSHAFDLSSEPLLRVGLVERTSAQFVLYFCVHHIIADAWSLEVFLNDLLSAYSQLQKGEHPTSLPPLRIQHKDYAAWLHQQNGDGSQSQAYWLDRMKGELPVLNFPLSYERPALQTYEGDTLTSTMPVEVTENLKRFSKKHESTYFTSLLAALYAFLHRYTGQEDMILGSPVACRDHEDLGGQIGLFVNTIPLRSQVRPDDNFERLFARVKEVIIEGTQHKHYPFDRLVEELGLVRDPSRSPLFDVMVNFQASADRLDRDLYDRWPIERFELPQTKSKFDFSFYFLDLGDRTELRLIYNTNLFTREYMHRVMNHFNLLAGRLVADPASPLATVDYLSATEKDQILSEFNTASGMPVRPKKMLEHFRECVVLNPEATAVFHEDETVSYGNLEKKSNQLSRYLAGAFEVGSGDRILLSLDRGPWLMIGILSILKNSASYIPIERDTPTAIREKIHAENDCKAVIDDAFIRQFKAAAETYSDESIAVGREVNPEVAVIYTTGSTGEPKGIAISESNILNRLHWMWNAYPFAAGEVSCLKTQINFVDHIWELFGPLLKGVPTVSFHKAEVLDLPSFMQKLGKHRVSRIVLVPSLLKLMLDDREGCREHLSQLAYWTSSGEVLPTKLIRRFYEVFDPSDHKLLNIYGSTEVTADATSFDTSESLKTTSGSRNIFNLTMGPEIDDVLMHVEQRDASLSSGNIEELLERFKVVDFSSTFSPGEYAAYLKEELVPSLINVASRKFIGHMTGPMPDFVRNMSRLVTRLNQNLVKIETSLAGTMIESEVVNFFHKVIYEQPDAYYEQYAFDKRGSLGFFTNGGTLSNITALHNALNNCLPAADDFGGLAKEGLPAALEYYGYKKAVILGSRWCHYSISKALKLFGLGTDAFEKLVLDKGSEAEVRDGVRRRIESLRAQKVLVIAIVGVAGTTESGQIEPLEMLGELASEYKINYHVDAAFGGAYLFSSNYRHLLAGIRYAHSVTICAHKQLYMPIGTSLCIFRNSDYVLEAENNTIYQARRDSYDLGKFTIEGTRNFNALILHGMLKVFGQNQIGDLLDGNKKLADDFAELIAQQQAFELFYEPDLNIVLYRYLPRLLREKTRFSTQEMDQLNRWNQQMQERQFERGHSFVSYTTINDHQRGGECTVFRTVFLNPDTTMFDLVEVLQEQLDIAFELEQEAGTSASMAEKVTALDRSMAHQLAGTCIGRPIANVKVYILDAHLQLVPIGVEGEICISGRSVTGGYLGDEALTHDKFVPNPLNPAETLFRTGDMGKWAANGEVIFVGRKDRQHKVRGNRVNTIYIEEVIAQMQGVDQVVVEATTEKLIAYMSLGHDFDAVNFRLALKSQLPDYMVPGEFIELAQFPITANGKIDRKQLEPGLGKHILRSGEKIEPRNALEEKVQACWQEVLEIEAISVFDDFFALGGHSLNLHQLVQKFRQVFGVQLNIQGLFLHTSIAAQAELIETTGNEGFVSIDRAPEREAYPVSDGQRRMWSLNQYVDSTAPFHITGAVTIREKVSIEHLRQAIAHAIERQEALRTNFVKDEEGTPQQIIRPVDEVDFELTLIDADGKSDAFVEHKLWESFARSFDLEHDFLFRAMLIQRSEHEFVFGYCLHHINGDAISMDVLLQDILHAYDHFENGNRELKAPLNLRYRDFALWENQQKKASSKKHRQFAEGFRNATKLNLPTAFGRPPVKTYGGETIYFNLEADLFKQLKQKSKVYSTTAFSIITAALNGLFYRYTHQDDILLGMTLDLRSGVGMADQVGFLVNTLPLRTKVNVEAGFHALCKATQQKAIQVMEFQTYALDDLLNDIDYQRESSHSPLFDVVINYESKETRASTLNLEAFPFEKRTAQFDLTFGFLETTDGIAAKIEYNTSIYDRDAAERIAQHFSGFLKAALKQDDTPLYDLDYLTAEEKAVVVFERTKPRDVDSQQRNVIDFFKVWKDRSPKSPAVCYMDRALTYGELDALSDRLAAQMLSKAAIEPGDFVVVKLPKSEYLVAAFLAVLKLGAAYVPIDPEFPEERIDFMEQDSHCRFVLDDSVLHDFLNHSGQINDLPAIEISPLAKAYVIYTSGTTGKPKGVAVSHQNLTNMFFNEHTPFDIQPSDVWSMFHSQCFDFSVWEMYGALLTGGSVVVIDKETARDPYLTKKELEERGVTMLSQTPSSFYSLTSVFRPHPASNQLRQVFFGGEALSPAQLAWWRKHYPELRFVNMYGTTETTIHATYKEITDVEIDHNLSNIGIALPGYETYVLGKHGELLPFGVEGELVIGGKGLSGEYLNNQLLTREKYIDHPWKQGEKLYRTGDVVKKIPGGEMIYIGRMDRQVKIRGHRIELAEIEQALLSKPEVSFARVTTRIDSDNQRELLAFFRSNIEEKVQPLVAFLKQKLPQYMIPLHYVQIDEIALNANGKLDEALLLEKHPPITVDQSSAVPPRSDLDRQILEIWHKVLRKEDLGIEDNLFEIGGNSLKAIQIMTAANQACEVELNLATLFGDFTIRNMADEVEKIRWFSTEDAVEVNDEGAETETFSI